MGEMADYALEQMMDLDEIEQQCTTFEEAQAHGLEDILYDYDCSRFPSVFHQQRRIDLPLVKKQLARPKPRIKTGSVWDRTEPVHEIVRGVTMALYGGSGKGKTRFACTATKPLHLIGSEDGTQSIATDKGIDFLKLNSSEEIRDLEQGYRDGRSSKCMPGTPYATVVLDTGTMLQDLVLREILGIDKIPEQKGWGNATQQQYGQCTAQCKEYFRALLDLASIGMNVIIICQERNFTEGKDSEILTPSIGSALTPSLAGWLHPACDYVAQMYVRRAKVEKIVKIGNKTLKQVVDDPKKVDFCLRTEVHEVYATKFRLPRGRELPQCLVDPTFPKVLDLIRGN